MQPKCWSCGALQEIVVEKVTVRQPGGLAHSTMTFAHHVRDWIAPRKPEHTVTAYDPTITQRLPHAQMEPGETHERQEYRPKSVSDITPHFVFSMVFSCAVGGIVIGCSGTARQVVGWASGAFAFSFLVTAWPVVFVGGGNVVAALEKLTRIDLDGDGQIGDIDVNLLTDVRTGAGQIRKTKATLPLSELRHWRTFCQEYVAGRCRFSGNAYEDMGGDRDVFDNIVHSWAMDDPATVLVDPLSMGERKTLRLTPLGKETVAIHATTSLQDILADLVTHLGTDRQLQKGRVGE